MKIHSVRSALDTASSRGCVCEAVSARRIKTKASAARLVPRGGLLMREDDGTYVPLDLVPAPMEPAAVPSTYIRPIVDEAAILKVIEDRAKRAGAR